MSLISVALQVIVVLPTGYGSPRRSPSLLVPVTFLIRQLSVAVGAVMVTDQEQSPGSAA